MPTFRVLPRHRIQEAVIASQVNGPQFAQRSVDMVEENGQMRQSKEGLWRQL